jgi:hypothetical protein
MLGYWPYATLKKTFLIYIFLSKRKHHEKYSPIPKFTRTLKQLILNKQGPARQFKTQVSVHKTLKKKKNKVQRRKCEPNIGRKQKNP